MSLSKRDFAQVLQAVMDDANQALRVIGTFTVSNPSIGPDGSPAPTSSTQVGGTGADGNLHAISTDNSGNQNVNVITSALPTGASTAANQATANTSLSTIATNTTGAATAANQATGNTSLATIATNSATQATAANQTTGNTSLSTIATNTGKIPSQGAALTAASTPVNIASDQVVPVSATALPLPSGAATSANQTTGNTSLSTIATNTSGLATSSNQTNASQKTQIVDGSGNVIGSTSNALNVNTTSSALPTGAATAANQTTGNTSLASIVTNTTGIATAANQSTANTSLATIATNTGAATPAGTNLIGKVGIDQTTPGTTNGVQVNAALPAGSNTIGAVNIAAAQTLATVTTVGAVTAITNALPTGTNTIGAITQAGSSGKANAPVYNIYSSTNVTTGAYVQLIASTTSACNYLDIFDSSGQAMILAIGGAGSEVDTYYVPPGGDQVLLNIAAGTRISYKALTGNATSGYLLMNLLK